LKDISIIIGGPQGAGLETSMAILGRALVRKGYGIIADREYFSNITGRHSYIHMLVSSVRLPRSIKYPVELVASMDPETIFTHFTDIGDKGILIYDKGHSNKKIDDISSMEDITKKRIKEVIIRHGIEPSVSSLLNYLEREKDITLVGIDFNSLLRKVIERYRVDPRQVSRYVSGILISAISTLIGLEEDFIRYSFEQQFRGKEHLIEQNMTIFGMVRDSLADFRNIARLDEPSIKLHKAFIATGNDIVAIAKIVAGVRYQSYYPITPAADESFLIEKYEYTEVGGRSLGPIVVVQTEDEIAAVNSAIGASLTGVRSSTATSGPGFDLMVEGLSWAGANEVPIVITYYQRGGPSTGQPTRGSQSDLLNAVFAAHGEFARIVLSSGDHVEAFYDTVEAFNMAEKFQVPVIHLLDKFLANTIATIPVPEVGRVSVDRGITSLGGRDYKRFDLSRVISHRAYLGTDDTVMWYAGDEHDEYGHIVEDPENRVKMYSKRIEKMKIILEQVPSDLKVTIYGDEDPDYVVVGWGSVKGVVLDAIDVLSEKLKLMYVNVKLLWPFPANEFLGIVKGMPRDRLIAVEHSYGVNITSLISMTTGIIIDRRVMKYTGRPITLNELVSALERVALMNEERVVLTYGA